MKVTSCPHCHKQVIALRKCTRCGTIQCESCGFSCCFCWGATRPLSPDYYDLVRQQNAMASAAQKTMRAGYGVRHSSGPAVKKAKGPLIAALALVLSLITGTAYFTHKSGLAPMATNPAPVVSQVSGTNLRPFNITNRTVVDINNIGEKKYGQEK